jgi:hypothetical protein
MTVETAGCGFLADRRPDILYERHIFHRLTGGRFDDGDISDPAAGGYGAKGGHQYDRLTRAAALDRTAALQSASWGLGQVLGQNCAMCGFKSIEEMVTAMCASEDDQLAAMAAFLKCSHLDNALRNRDWTAFARGYNGPNFAQNDYDGKLGRSFQKLSTEGLPDLRVRTAQLYLRYCGFDPGPVDGVIGNRTRMAISGFRKQQRLPLFGTLDDEIMARLEQCATG